MAAPPDAVGLSLQIPTGETIVDAFGIRSPAYGTVVSCLVALWRAVHGRRDIATAFGRWSDCLHAVYGACDVQEDLFIRHTYLATIAKLMAWKHLTGSTVAPPEDAIGDLLDGRLFARYGIANLVDDLFSWPAWQEEGARGESRESKRKRGPSAAGPEVESNGQGSPHRLVNAAALHSLLTPHASRLTPEYLPL